MQITLANIRPEPVKGEIALLDGLADKGEGHQVFERDENGFFLEGAFALIFRNLQDALVTWAEDVHPATDKGGFFLKLRRIA